MSLRACRSCGVLEERRTDTKGTLHLNLDPISGLCIDCLPRRVNTFRSRRTAPGQEPLSNVVPFDSKMAQAGKESE